MRIGELSVRTGVSTRSLRYYEEQGLLESERSPAGYRQYDEAHVLRVQQIQAFLTAGLSSRTIAEMVPCMAVPSSGKAHIAMATMKRERERLNAAIGSLLTARSALDGLIETNRNYLEQARP